MALYQLNNKITILSKIPKVPFEEAVVDYGRDTSLENVVIDGQTFEEQPAVEPEVLSVEQAPLPPPFPTNVEMPPPMPVKSAPSSMDWMIGMQERPVESDLQHIVNPPAEVEEVVPVATTVETNEPVDTSEFNKNEHHILVVNGKQKKISKKSSYLLDMMILEE